MRVAKRYVTSSNAILAKNGKILKLSNSVTDNFNKSTKSNKTIAISEKNFDFLKKQNISQLLNKEAWPCYIMKLYTEIKNKKFSKIFELNNEKKMV